MDAGTGVAAGLAPPDDMTAFVGTTATQELRASDPDGDALRFSLASGPPYGHVVARVTLFDVQGRVVTRALDARTVPAGDHEVILGGRGGGASDLASGIYSYRVEASGTVVCGRFTVLK